MTFVNASTCCLHIASAGGAGPVAFSCYVLLECEKQAVVACCCRSVGHLGIASITKGTGTAFAACQDGKA